MITTSNRLWALASIAAALWLSSTPLTAQDQRQGRGNFDPEQMRQRMMERYREQLEVTGDAEWKVIEARITKINEARREVGFGGMMGRGMRPGGPGGQGGPGGGGDDQAATRRRAFGGEPSAELEALQKAIDSKASADEIKSKLAAYRTSRKEKQAKLEAAQEELRKVLSVRQEAVAVVNGLLN